MMSCSANYPYWACCNIQIIFTGNILILIYIFYCIKYYYITIHIYFVKQWIFLYIFPFQGNYLLIWPFGFLYDENTCNYLISAYAERGLYFQIYFYSYWSQNNTYVHWIVGLFLENNLQTSPSLKKSRW